MTIRRTLRTFARTMTLGLSLLVAVPATEAAAGQLACESPLIKMWLAERDAAATGLVRAWLGGADERTLGRAIGDLLRWEVLLAPCAPPLKIEDFYLDGAEEPEQVPGHLLVRILVQQGIDIQPSAFFAGRTFRLRRPEVSP